MMPSIPFELIAIILLMLPTEALVKFQCVCKAWRDLIRDPIFIKKHFQTWSSKGNCYILHVPLKPSNGRAFSLLCEKTFERVSIIEIPPQLSTLNFVLVGSCNGLLCLTERNSYGTTICLCNPSIRQCRMVNFSNNNLVGTWENSQYDIDIALGFGHLDEANDLKIIRIAFGNDRDDAAGNDVDHDTDWDDNNEIVQSKVHVYSLVTNTWKNIEVDYFPWEILDISSEVQVNESIHWKVIHRDINEDVMVILAFHLRTEVFQQIHLPNYEVDGEDLVELIGVFKGKLCLFSFHLVNQQPLQEQCHLWVMMEYGALSSWTKTHTIVVNPGIARPLIFTEADKFIYEDVNQNLFICDFSNKITGFIGQVEQNDHQNFVTYKDSLVLLEG